MCRDTLTQNNPYYVFVSGRSGNNKGASAASGSTGDLETRRIMMTSCTDLISRFPSFCAQIGGPGQSCCRSCRTADISKYAPSQLEAGTTCTYKLGFCSLILVRLLKFRVEGLGCNPRLDHGVYTFEQGTVESLLSDPPLSKISIIQLHTYSANPS